MNKETYHKDKNIKKSKEELELLAYGNKVHTLFERIDFVNNKIPDIKDLGITIYDTIGSNNYFRLDDSQRALQNSNDFTYGILHDEVISVDNDHATYDKILFPSIDKYHKAIQNEIQMFF